MTWNEYGSTVTLTHAGASDGDAQLFVTAPNGTESTPAVTHNADQWSGSVTANQYDQWEYAWRLDGSIVETGVFQVGGPWYGSLALLRRRVNRTNTSADDLLASALLAASRQLEEACDGRVFYLADTATARQFPTRRTVRTADGYRLPVDDMGEVPSTVEVGDGTTWTTVADAVPWPFNALSKSQAATGLVSQTDWTRWRLARVTVKWGWPVEPQDIVQAAQMQAHKLYARRNSPEGVAGSSEWGVVRVQDDKDVMRLLAPYVTTFRVA